MRKRLEQNSQVLESMFFILWYSNWVAILATLLGCAQDKSILLRVHPKLHPGLRPLGWSKILARSERWEIRVVGKDKKGLQRKWTVPSKVNNLQVQAELPESLTNEWIIELVLVSGNMGHGFEPILKGRVTVNRRDFDKKIDIELAWTGTSGLSP